MFDQLGSLVARRRAWILVVWVVVVAAVHMVAPRWNSVTKDGDFAYLPQDRTSVRGNQLLSNGFPDYYSKSQLALVLAREDGKLKVEDYKIGDELLRRYPAPSNEEETPSPEKPAPPKPSQAEKPAGEDAPSTTEAKGGDGDAKAGEGKKEGEEKPENESTEPEAGESEKNAPETENASEVKPAEENTDENAGASRQSGSDPAANEEKETKPAADKSVEPPSDSPVSAVWHYDTPVIKSRLVTMGPDGKGEAAMIVLHLRKEFMAIENMKFVESVYDTLDEIRARPDFPKGLKLGVTGSAAIGADMLLAAKESIRNTEWTTIALVFLILLLV